MSPHFLQPYCSWTKTTQLIKLTESLLSGLAQFFSLGILSQINYLLALADSIVRSETIRRGLFSLQDSRRDVIAGVSLTSTLVPAPALPLLDSEGAVEGAGEGGAEGCGEGA